MKFLWCTLHVKDIDASVRFYEQIVGLRETRRMPGPGGGIVFLGDGETQIELIGSGTGCIGAGVSVSFAVDDLDAKMAGVQEMGIAIHSGPFAPSPHIRFFHVQDPDGLIVQFVEQKKG